MRRQISKAITILVVTAFLSTSISYNYIPSYISNSKDTLRAMSAVKNAAVDMRQSLLTAALKTEERISFLKYPHALGCSSADIKIDLLKKEMIISLKAMLAKKGPMALLAERFIKRAINVFEKPAPISLGKALFTKNTNFKVGFEPTVPILSDITTETTGLTAVVLTKEGLRGKALGLDKNNPAEKKQISQIKVQSDARAKKIFEEIVEERNTILMVRVSEGFGRDGVEESFKTNDVIVPNALLGEVADIRDAIERGETFYISMSRKRYEIEDAIIDVIEGTNPFVTDVQGKALEELGDDESGATSIILKGPGAGSLGNCPDVYADGIFTAVPADKKQGFLKNILDPEETAKNPDKIEEYLIRIAKANDIVIDDLEVVVMEREREGKRLAVLREIRKKHSGLVITTIKDGTVAHTLVATFGRKEGKHKVVMTVGGSPETFFNLAVAGGIYKDTAIASVRVYSKGVNKVSDAKGAEDAKDLNRRYAFSEKEIANIERLRPDDADEILTGKKLFTQEDVEGDVAGSVSFITNNGVYAKSGVTISENSNLYTETTLRFATVDKRPYAWFEKQDYANFWYGLSEGDKVVPESVNAILNNISWTHTSLTIDKLTKESYEILGQLSEIRDELLRFQYHKQNIEQAAAKSSSAGDISKVEAAIQITPETEPDDLMFAFQHIEKPMVVINHSGLKDYLGGTTERSNEQLKALLMRGFDAIVAFGDFPMEYKGKDYLAAGIRKFPDTIEGIKARIFDYNQATALGLDYPDRLYRLHENAVAIRTMNNEWLITVFGDMPLTVEVEEKNMNLWSALKHDLITLNQAKAKVIKELSTKQEVLYEIDVLFDNINKRYLNRMLLAYKPVQAIREAAIPVELAEYRLGYIQEAIADKLGVSRDKVDIIYGGGGSASNIIELGEAGIAHIVNVIDYIPWQKAINGEDVKALFADRSKECFSLPIILGVTVQAGMGEYPDGAYCGNISAKFLKKAGVGVVLLPHSLSDLNRKRIIEQMEEAQISYADIRERGSEVFVAAWAGSDKKWGYSYPARVINISLADDLSEAIEEAEDSGEAIVWNIPPEQLRLISHQINLKPSSTGRSVKEANQMIEAAIGFLLSIADVSELTSDKVQIIKDIIEEQCDDLKWMSYKIFIDTTSLFTDTIKSRNRAEQIVKTMNLPFELSGLMAQESEVNGILTRVAQEKIGGILIDDQAPDMSQEQKILLLSLYGKGSPICAALEEKLKVRIILSSQYFLEDKMPNMIAISSRNMEKARGIMRINVVIDDNINNFIPIGPNLVLAQQLLLYNLDGFRNEIIRKRISDIYRVIAKQPMADVIIEAFVLTKIFTLKLPPAVPVDKNYYTELEKISAYTLVAA